jgi:hypothetical protein
MPGVTSSGKLPGSTNIDEQRASNAYGMRYINIDKIITNELNERFDQIDIQSLAFSIMGNGLFHNFVTTKENENGEVRLISGERRLRACRLIRDEYPDKFKEQFPGALLPCHVRPEMSKVDEEIALIEANAQVRTQTLEKNIKDIQRLLELYEMRNAEDDDERISKKIADSYKMTERQIYKYIAITKLNPELREAWENKIITINTAAEIAGFGETEQMMLAEVLKEEGKLTEDDIQAARELQKTKEAANERLDYTDKKIKAFEQLKEEASNEKERELAESKINEMQEEQKEIMSSLSNAEMKRMRALTRSNNMIDKVINDLNALEKMPEKSRALPEISARLEILKLKLEEAAKKLGNPDEKNKDEKNKTENEE